MVSEIRASLSDPLPSARADRDPSRERDPHAGQRQPRGHRPPGEEHAADEAGPRVPKVGLLLDVTA